jgi:gem associated protein 8
MSFILILHVFFADSDHAVLLPRQQVGLQRTQEMKLMYGEAAPMILGMETAMQLSFDRNCDLRQPKLWPNIPLKL